MKKKELYIPVNVPDRSELIPGFGIMELVACGIALVLAVVAAIIIYQFKGILWAVGTGIVILATAIMLFRKNSYGENLVIRIKYVLAFKRSQKKYFYEHYNIYEGEVKNEKRRTERLPGTDSK